MAVLLVLLTLFVINRLLRMPLGRAWEALREDEIACRSLGYWDKGIQDPISRQQVETLDANIREVGARAYFPFKDQGQGVIHVMGPEQGATLPADCVRRHTR